METNINSSYFDGVLIKLKRAYSKDETVSALIKKLSETEVELGKATSYIHELEFKNDEKNWYERYKKLKEQFNNINKQLKLDELYLQKDKENKKLRLELNKLRETNNNLINRIFLLENK